VTVGIQGLLTTQCLPFLDQLPLSFAPWAQSAALSAMAVAWGRLCVDVPSQGSNLNDFNENEISTLLCNTLNTMRGAPDPLCPEFSGEAFQKVTRGESAEDFSGRSIDKRPDLQLRTSIPPAGSLGWEEPTLYVEVKIVDVTSHRVRSYCRDGIARFVRGDYAWTMSCGMMLGYARDSIAIEPALVNYLAQEQSQLDYRVVSLPSVHPGPLPSTVQLAYYSTHRRDWQHRNGRQPGEIELTHLWLTAS